MIVGSICARGGSKGVPRKNLRHLGGKRLLAYAIECAVEAKMIDRVVVSTDDEEIASVAIEIGAEVPFMRPAFLATDGASKWDVFRHLARTLEQRSGTRVDVLVDLDVGVPLRLPTDVDGAVNTLLSGEADVVITAYAAERNPYFNMVEQADDGYVRVVNGSKSPVTCRQQAPLVYSLSPAAYAVRRDALERYDHWSLARMQIYEIPRGRGIDIDTELDFQLVKFLIENVGNGGGNR